MLAKHKQIQPSRDQLDLIGNLVSNIEKSLKKISDKLVDEELAKLPAQEASTTPETQKTDEPPKVDESKEKYRHLKGVVRVGTIVKTLFLKSDRDIHLVVLTSNAPTYTFVKRISDELDTELALVSKEADSAKATEIKTEINEVEMKPSDEKKPDEAPTSEFKPPKVIYHMDKSEHLIKNEACIKIKCELPDSDFLNEDTDNYRIKITFTSMSLLPQQPLESGTPAPSTEPQTTDTDISLAMCKNALTEIRRVKWFNARLKPIANAILILRIMRDLCQRLPTWSVLNDWLLELIIDKIFLKNKYEDITLKLRAVFECVSSGVLFMSALSIQHKALPPPLQAQKKVESTDAEMKEATSAETTSKPAENTEITLGFCDPCAEFRSEANVFEEHLTVQQREELFASAQNLLRLLTFRRAHELLAIDLIKMSSAHPHKNRFNNNENKFKRNKNNKNGQVPKTDEMPTATEARDENPLKTEAVSMETSAPL